MTRPPWTRSLPARAGALLGVGVVLAASAIGSQPAQAVSAAAPAAPAAVPCGQVSVKLVPSCGAWFGLSATPQTHAKLAYLEGLVNRKFDIVYNFHRIGDTLPTPSERQLVKEGRMLHVNIETTQLSWAQVAAGAADAALTKQAQGLKSLNVPVMINFDHEPDAKKKAVRGTPAEFVAAFRHVHDVFDQAGATNAVWVWVTTGYKGNFGRLLALYPGNAYVDWLSWEAYTGVGCDENPTLGTAASFYKNVSPMYNWVRTTGAAGGIDASKPIIISEYDAVYNTPDPTVTANWYRGIPGALQTSFPNIKAIQKWDVPGNCRYATDTDPEITAAIRAIGTKPYLNQPRPYGPS